MDSEETRSDIPSGIMNTVERKAKWYEMILCHFYDLIAEVNLATGRYVQGAFKSTLFPAPACGDYELEFFRVLKQAVSPSDVVSVEEVFSLEALRRANQRGEQNISCQYRMLKGDGSRVWREAVGFFLEEEEGTAALIAHRNISHQKEREIRRHAARQYDMALRKIYDELYELDITRNSYRIVYHDDHKFVTPPERGILSAVVPLVAEKMIHPEDARRFLRYFDVERMRREFAAGKDCLIDEFRKLWLDGEFHWASLTTFPVEDTADGDELFLCFIMDIDAKKQAEEVEKQNKLLKQRQDDDERYRIIVEQTGAMVLEWNHDTERHFVSPTLIQDYWGAYDGRDVFQLWQEDRVVLPEDHAALNGLQSEIRGGANYAEAMLRFHHRKRGYIWCKMAITCVRRDDNSIRRIVGTVSDYDETMKSEQELKYRAEFDTLTGIYNIRAFYSKCELLLRENRTRRHAMIRMDINRFKFINEIYGMEAGDRLLCFIAETIRDFMNGEGAYGRLGGDVFCICTAFQEESEIVALIKKIAERLEGYGLGYKVQPSFGVCVVDEECREAEISILCDWANLALKTIKGNLRRRWAFYDDELRAHQLDERMIEDEMENALENGQFSVYLQPKHDIFSRRIIGAEALVRWKHPREGVMAPGRFIPLFERNGFIIRLDEYVWEETCKTMRCWLDKGWKPVPVSVNVSREHIYNPNFVQTLLELTEKYNLPHSLLELELTESTFIENTAELYATMACLQKQGFAFSMDDFGSGYSSLNMLKNAPIDTVKLDREFLNETVSTQRGRTVIRYTIMMAKKLSFNVIAEGVETAEQAAFLLQSGCSSAQGYYFSRPMCIIDFEEITFGLKRV